MRTCTTCQTSFGTDEARCPTCQAPADAVDRIDPTPSSRRILGRGPAGATGPTPAPAPINLAHPGHGTPPGRAGVGGWLAAPPPQPSPAPSGGQANQGPAGGAPGLTTQGMHSSSTGVQGRPPIGRRVQLDGVVSGNVASSSRHVSRWAIYMVLLVGVGIYLLAAAVAFFYVFFIVAGFIAALAVLMAFVGGSKAGMGGLFSMSGAVARFFATLVTAPLSAVSGRAAPTLDTAAFRLTDGGGAVSNCVAEGALPPGTIRNGDQITVKGWVGLDRSIKVSSIANVRTGTMSRPRKPLGFWVAKGAEVLVIIGGIALLLTWMVSGAERPW